MLSRLKRLVPESLISFYHLFLSRLAAWWYRHPSRETIVIGVTGTNGKTTTSYLIAKALEASGKKTGCTTTALFKIADREWLNASKMTMLGRFQLQKLLRQMVNEGCAYAVVETSSQGIVQYRHRGIEYDIAVFTNLTPEHIEAHGGFEAYKAAKIELFRHVASGKRKMIDGRVIPKIAVLNADDPHAADFAVPGFDRVISYSTKRDSSSAETICAENIRLEANGSSFEIRGKNVKLQIPSRVNVQNALAALAVTSALGLSLDNVIQQLERVSVVPGRFERIDEGQPWTVLVDYAPEPASLERLYETVAMIPHERIIHVLGSAGGGRDVARRPILGNIAGSKADIVIVTNEDPYDDPPRQIIDQVAAGACEAGKRDGQSLFCIDDRREAIEQAMRLARAGDFVLLTGKGSEQAIVVNDGKKIPWDERRVAREAIQLALASKVPTAA